MVEVALVPTRPKLALMELVFERAEPRVCPYLPDQQMRLINALAPELTDATFERMLNEGFRKFGMHLFRPDCEGCSACRSLRVPAAGFIPSRSQRRTWIRNQDLETRFGPPALTPAHRALYTRYHDSKSAQQDWPVQEWSSLEYRFAFLINPVPAEEITLWKSGALVGVCVYDLTPTILSCVYHYHDPDERERGLGTFLLMNAIARARELGKPWAHLGYHVAGCRSMNYKSRYRPCETLEEGGTWRPCETEHVVR